MDDRSPITNCWGTAHTVTVEAEHFPIYLGSEGAAYNHHPQRLTAGTIRGLSRYR